MTYDQFVRQMENWAKANQLQRNLEVRQLVEHMRSKGYSDAEISRLKFTHRTEEE